MLEKRKKPRRKPRSRLMEAFPSYMQEAFFGRELLDIPVNRLSTDFDMSAPLTDSDSEEVGDSSLITNDNSSTICLNQVQFIFSFLEVLHRCKLC